MSMRNDSQAIVHQKQLSFGHLIITLYPNGDYPAIGGMRRIEYANLEAAMMDCKNLALSMLHKASAHDLPLSGGKAVIFCTNEVWSLHRVQILKEAALFIESLKGKYITAIDMGTNMKDMDQISLITKHVCAHSMHDQTTYYTALGVYHALKAACQWSKIDLDSANILIEGLGQVSTALIEILSSNHTSTIYGLDINPERFESFIEKVVPYQPGQKVDIFCPNATGGTVSKKRILDIGCNLVCGAANNQLAQGETIPSLPCVTVQDYIANGGGLIYVFHQLQKSSEKTLQNHIQSIHNKTIEFLQTMYHAKNAN
ncbi:MAG: Glu/Leu/Phe/Val dehydrogenase [Gammaproteobacteria bacterium]|nr:Glu/Leu/Phe/Val dehydrogenase [Gammaproteobacteria bacterium]